MLLPAQSAGVPPTVSVNVSQLTPSTHVASPFEVPPTAVPSHINGGDAGEIVPLPGLAARERRTETKINPDTSAIPGNNQNNRVLLRRNFSNIPCLLKFCKSAKNKAPEESRHVEIPSGGIKV